MLYIFGGLAIVIPALMIPSILLMNKMIAIASQQALPPATSRYKLPWTANKLLNAARQKSPDVLCAKCHNQIYLENDYVCKACVPKVKMRLAGWDWELSQEAAERLKKN